MASSIVIQDVFFVLTKTIAIANAGLSLSLPLVQVAAIAKAVTTIAESIASIAKSVA